MIASWSNRWQHGRLTARLLLVIVLLQLAASPLASARQPSPAGTPTARPMPSRPGCDASPASATGLVSVLRQPVAADPDVNDPQGDPIPPAERSTLGELVGRWSTCLASGNVRGMLGLFTADGVRRLFGEQSPYVAGPAGLRISVLAVGDVVRLRDGRVAARISVDPTGNGTAAPESLLMIIEAGEDGVWRIDHLDSPAPAVGPSGPASDPGAPARALLRYPVSPGPNVAVQAPGPDVPMRGGDSARTGNQPGPLPEGEPVATWRAPTGWQSDDQPVAARGLVYFGGASLGERAPLLEAVDAVTGGVRWQTTAPVAWAEFSDAPALAGDVLFAPVQAPISGVLAVAAPTGQALWFAPFGFMSVTAPVADTDAVYVAGWGLQNARDRTRSDTVGAVIALDQRTGRERWRFLAPARFGPVAAGRQSIFVPSDKGLFALDRATGQKRWQTRFSPGPEETPTVSGEVVAFTGTEITSGKTGVFALDANSGALLWRLDLPKEVGARAGTAATGDTLYVTWWESAEDDPGGGLPSLRAYDLANGQERWIFRGDAVASADWGPGGAVTAPIIVGDQVVFGVSIRVPASGDSEGQSGLFAIDRQTGEPRWHAASTTPIGSTPVALNGRIFAMEGARPRGEATTGNLLAFSAE